jgi:hypothetical protein
MPARAKDEVLLKLWSSWEDGIGYLYDEPGIAGLYYANKILGLRGELRPAPAFLGANTDGSPSLTEIDITPGVSTRSPISGSVTMQYSFEEIPTNLTASEAYFYPIVNNNGVLDGTTIGAAIYKMDLRNSGYGTYLSEGISTDLSNDPLGSPMRYGGDNHAGDNRAHWFVPGCRTGASFRDICRLTTVASAGAADTWHRSSTIGGGVTATTADHLALLNFQGSKVLRGSGASILATNGNPLHDGDWGSYNPVGDRKERSLALQSLLDAMFVFNKDGIYSFNDKVQSGLVFQDFKYWRTLLRESALVPFKGGLLIGHSSGLQYYQVKNLPVSIGPDARFASLGMGPPGGPTEFSNGRYHGVAVAGDFLYTIYQPTPTGGTGVGSGTARNALVLFGTPKNLIDPSDVTWQVIGNINLSHKGMFHGCHVSTLGFPESSDQSSPALWVPSSNSDGTTVTLKRMNLDNRATPYRARSEPHVVVNNSTEGTSCADAWLSELMFPEPIELTKLVVYTQDMIYAGSNNLGPDCWKFSVIINGAPEQSSLISGISSLADIPIGRVNRNGRIEIEMDLQDVHRLMLHVAFQSTISSSAPIGSPLQTRVPPTIKRIELWGRKQ